MVFLRLSEASQADRPSFPQSARGDRRTIAKPITNGTPVSDGVEIASISGMRSQNHRIHQQSDKSCGQVTPTRLRERCLTDADLRAVQIYARGLLFCDRTNQRDAISSIKEFP